MQIHVTRYLNSLVFMLYQYILPGKMSSSYHIWMSRSYDTPLQLPPIPYFPPRTEGYASTSLTEFRHKFKNPKSCPCKSCETCLYRNGNNWSMTFYTFIDLESWYRLTFCIYKHYFTSTFGTCFLSVQNYYNLSFLGIF